MSLKALARSANSSRPRTSTRSLRWPLASALAASERRRSVRTIERASRYVTIAISISDPASTSGCRVRRACSGIDRGLRESATNARPFGSASSELASARKDTDATRTPVGRPVVRERLAAAAAGDHATAAAATSSSSGDSDAPSCAEQPLVDRHADETPPSVEPPSVTVTVRRRPGRPANRPAAHELSPRHPARERRRGATSPCRGRAVPAEALGRPVLGPGAAAASSRPAYPHGRAQRRLQPCVDAAGLAALRERVVAVEGDANGRSASRANQRKSLSLKLPINSSSSSRLRLPIPAYSSRCGRNGGNHEAFLGARRRSGTHSSRRRRLALRCPHGL